MNARLRKCRESLGLTTRDFGERIKLSGSAITNMETGTRNITDRTIQLICNEFNVNEHWLRTGEGEMFVQKTRDEKIAYFIGQVLSEEGDSFKKRLIDVLCALDEQDWQALERIAEKMKKGEY